MSKLQKNWPIQHRNGWICFPTGKERENICTKCQQQKLKALNCYYNLDILKSIFLLQKNTKISAACQNNQNRKHLNASTTQAKLNSIHFPNARKHENNCQISKQWKLKALKCQYNRGIVYSFFLRQENMKISINVKTTNWRPLNAKKKKKTRLNPFSCCKRTWN